MVAAASLCLSDKLIADIRLPKIFSDNMVLQRNAKIQVWGWAAAGEELQISLGDSTKQCKANDKGKWIATLPAMKAGGPFELKIEGKEASVVITNVHIGEVWLCSGQSNMEWPINKTLTGETDEEKQKQLADFQNDRIRFFSVGRSALETVPDDLAEPTSWSVCTPESSASFSAVAYHFAEQLIQQLDLQEEYKEKKLVIGLINSTWGGSACEAWISNESLVANENLKPLLDHWKDNENVDRKRPSALFNGMIAPLKQFSIRGTIWYQGEANVGRGAQYLELMPTLISDWRSQLNNETMPFFMVQLAPFRYKGKAPEALAEVRDAQLETMKTMENVGMVVTTDVGQIDDIHPIEKKEVGRRLALWALANVHNMEDIVYSGPIMSSSSVSGKEILVTFEHVGEGLAAEGELTDFQICGEDKQFVPATAMIKDKNQVRVFSDQVDNPIAVRFAWSDTAEPNLQNSAGLPASPFRTDEFKLQSAGKNY